MEAPALARRFVRGLEGGQHAGQVDDVELLASELVTAAIRHGSGPVVLTIQIRPEDLVIRVRVESHLPGWPARVPRLVQSLCHDCGVESAHHPRGTIFWGLLHDPH